MTVVVDGIALVQFADFADRLPGSSSRNVEYLSRKGRFPPGIRLSPRGPLLYSKVAVEAWFTDVLAPVLANRESTV